MYACLHTCPPMQTCTHTHTYPCAAHINLQGEREREQVKNLKMYFREEHRQMPKKHPQRYCCCWWWQEFNTTIYCCLDTRFLKTAKLTSLGVGKLILPFWKTIWSLSIKFKRAMGSQGSTRAWKAAPGTSISGGQQAEEQSTSTSDNPVIYNSDLLVRQTSAIKAQTWREQTTTLLESEAHSTRGNPCLTLLMRPRTQD